MDHSTSTINDNQETKQGNTKSIRYNRAPGGGGPANPHRARGPPR